MENFTTVVLLVHDCVTRQLPTFYYYSATCLIALLSLYHVKTKYTTMLKPLLTIVQLTLKINVQPAEKANSQTNLFEMRRTRQSNWTYINCIANIFDCPWPWNFALQRVR